ncbi:hypothetical protein [Methylomonas sp. AM2-LC]|uniref:hypothetical protein n=1 Tax=Methylomonas sp. AM2-LC TaxID=3153301 RepID=UPI003264251A
MFNLFKYCWHYFLLFIFFSISAQAADWKVDGSLSQMFGYDDNFRLAKNPQGSFEFFLTPQVNFKRNDDDWNIAGSGSYGVRQYTYSLYDNEPQNYSINTDYKTARTIWGLNADYNKVLTNSIASTDTGNFLTSSTRITEALNPTFTYLLNANDSIKLSANYLASTYTGGSGLVNNTTQSGTLDWKRVWTDRLTQNLTGSYSRSDFTSNFQRITETYSANVGLLYKMTQHWDINSVIGERFTQQSSVANSNSSSTSSGWVANIRLNHEDIQSSEYVMLSRSVNPSGLGVLTQQTAFTVGYNYKFSDRWNANINGGYSMIDTLGQAATTGSIYANRTYLTFQPTINWKMQRDIDIGLTFIYRQQDYTYSAVSKALMLTFNYNWSGFNISR